MNLTQEELDAMPRLTEARVLDCQGPNGEIAPLKLWDAKGQPWQVGYDGGVLKKTPWGHMPGIKVPVTKDGVTTMRDVDAPY